MYSLHDEDPSMRECIETFVYGLAREIDDLQEAELGGDLAEVEKLAEQLLAGARRAGYPSLIDVAETTMSACRAGDPEEVHKGIVELTELAQRVRRGSRGAA